MRLVADDITAMRAQRTVLSGISFTLPAGHGLLLTGPNGSGKTTLLRVIAGYLPAAGGTVRLEEAGGDDDISARCHFIGHLPQTKAGLTVRENLEFDARFLGTGDPVAVDMAMRRLGLTDLSDIRAGYLSAGQRRRVALARLLVARRPIWLLDEPSVSLDQASTAVLATLIGEHRAQGGIVIAATHIPLGLTDAGELKLGGGAA
jgi:heme exporter protein A